MEKGDDCMFGVNITELVVEVSEVPEVLLSSGVGLGGGSALSREYADGVAQSSPLQGVLWCHWKPSTYSCSRIRFVT